MNLPEELIELVLQHVKKYDCSVDLWNCIRTCRQWHRIGLGLYKGLGLGIAVNIESDTNRCDVQEEIQGPSSGFRTSMDLRIPSGAYLSQIKSLTLNVSHRHITTSTRLHPPSDVTRSLKALFQSTIALTTFSIKFQDGWDTPGMNVPAIPGSMLAHIVEILPSMITNLELDTAGTDLPLCDTFISKEPRGHICAQLNKILPRLRNLRLRIGHVCDDLLPLNANAPPCETVRGCDYCDNGERATCTLVRTWEMRNMTIWLPWGQSFSNNSLAAASYALLNPTRRNTAVVLFITQIDNLHVGRTSISDPASHSFKRFTWTIDTNVPKALQAKIPYFRVEPIRGGSAYLEDTTFLFGSTDDQHCTECEQLRAVPLLLCRLSGSPDQVPDASETTTYSYVAEQTAEHMHGWTQSGHYGYRFPVSESDNPSKPFFHKAGVWPCLFPDCRVRSKTLLHLRGHHLYAHPKHAHWDLWNGFAPCPSTGCERIGENGFKDSKSYRNHLLQHHRHECTAKLALQ